MRKRKFYDIKCLMHFDFPYLNEPHEGLADETGMDQWEEVGSVTMNTSPKFGYRCVYFSNNNSYIISTNPCKLWNIDTSKKYTINFFIKISNSQTNSIFELDDKLIIGINNNNNITVYSEILNINNIITSSITIPYDTWTFISIQIFNNKLLIFIDGNKSIEVQIPNIILIINQVMLGKFVGYIDEFIFRFSANGASSIPLKQYIGKAIINNRNNKLLNDNQLNDNPSNDDSLNDISLNNNLLYDEIITKQCQINNYSIINNIISDNIISVNNWSMGIYDLKPNDEVFIHFTSKKSNDEIFLGNYSFNRIVSIDDNNVITLKNNHNITNDMLSNYHIQIITVPNYNSLTITSSAKITPKLWKNHTGGGIVVFKCKNDCIIDGKIITHSYGCIRNDFQQLRNSNLIDNFIPSQGGGIFIQVGKKITINGSARLGAIWSGTGENSNGKAGYGGGNQIGGGKGGSAYGSGSGGNVGKKGGYGDCGGGGGGCKGDGGNHPHSYWPHNNIYKNYAGGGGGGCQGAPGGKGGTYPLPKTRNETYYDTDIYDGKPGTINGGNGGFGYHSGIYNNNYNGGGGGGAPGGNGGSSYTYTNRTSYTLNGGIAGASIIIIAERGSIDKKSLSTGGAIGESSKQIIEYYNSGKIKSNKTYYGGSGGAGGTGFCYLGINKLY